MNIVTRMLRFISSDQAHVFVDLNVTSQNLRSSSHAHSLISVNPLSERRRRSATRLCGMCGG